MASLKDLLQRTMLFTAARDGGVDAYSKLKHATTAELLFPEPAASPGSSAEDRSIWSFKHQASEPARVTDVKARVEAHGHSMKVFDEVAVESVTVKLAPGEPELNLPLTTTYLVSKYSIKNGKINARSAGWWQLESKIDVGILLVFAYELVLASGADPRPLSLDDIEGLGDRFFPFPDVPLDDPDREGEPPQVTEDAGVPQFVETGQMVTINVSRPWVVVAVGFTTCKERPDFEPAGVLGAGRVYPHVMVTCNQQLARAETRILLKRPAKVMVHSDEALPDVHALFVTDTNEVRGTPIPVWSNFFDYYDVNPAMGTELQFVDPMKKTERTVKGGILREATTRIGGTYQASSEFKKMPGQGAFDSIHLAPRMKFHNPATGLTITDIPMAPFCEHDCLHTHVRWGKPTPSAVIPKSNNGFEGRKPYEKLTAPLVPGNQAVHVTPLSPSSLRYRAAAGGPLPAGSWTVFNHHGSAYSLSIASPAVFATSRFGVATLVIQLLEPFTRPLGFISPIFDREITDVNPTSSIAALYQRLQFTGTAAPDVWEPRIKILDLDLCRRT